MIATLIVKPTTKPLFKTNTKSGELTLSTRSSLTRSISR